MKIRSNIFAGILLAGVLMVPFQLMAMNKNVVDEETVAAYVERRDEIIISIRSVFEQLLVLLNQEDGNQTIGKKVEVLTGEFKALAHMLSDLPEFQLQVKELNIALVDHVKHYENYVQNQSMTKERLTLLEQYNSLKAGQFHDTLTKVQEALANVVGTYQVDNQILYERVAALERSLQAFTKNRFLDAAQVCKESVVSMQPVINVENDELKNRVQALEQQLLDLNAPYRITLLAKIVATKISNNIMRFVPESGRHKIAAISSVVIVLVTTMVYYQFCSGVDVAAMSATCAKAYTLLGLLGVPVTFVQTFVGKFFSN